MSLPLKRHSIGIMPSGFNERCLEGMGKAFDTSFSELVYLGKMSEFTVMKSTKLVIRNSSLEMERSFWWPTYFMRKKRLEWNFPAV